MNRNFSLIIAAVIGVSLLGGSWFLMQSWRESARVHDFSIPDIDRNTVTLSDYRDEVVVLDFMATWCGPCKAAMPDLVSLYNEIGDQFVMISISVDPTSDTAPVLREWAETYGATWIHARDLADPSVTQQFDVFNIPTYLIIERDGKIRYRHGPVSKLRLKTEILSLVNK
jgi:thiol-disulfide isomerase/thioredoxin